MSVHDSTTVLFKLSSTLDPCNNVVRMGPVEKLTLTKIPGLVMAFVLFTLNFDPLGANWWHIRYHTDFKNG